MDELTEDEKSEINTIKAVGIRAFSEQLENFNTSKQINDVKLTLEELGMYNDIQDTSRLTTIFQQEIHRIQIYTSISDVLVVKPYRTIHDSTSRVLSRQASVKDYIRLVLGGLLTTGIIIGCSKIVDHLLKNIIYNYSPNIIREVAKFILYIRAHPVSFTLPLFSFISFIMNVFHLSIPIHTHLRTLALVVLPTHFCIGYVLGVTAVFSVRLYYARAYEKIKSYLELKYDGLYFNTDLDTIHKIILSGAVTSVEQLENYLLSEPALRSLLSSKLDNQNLIWKAIALNKNNEIEILAKIFEDQLNRFSNTQFKVIFPKLITKLNKIAEKNSQFYVIFDQPLKALQARFKQELKASNNSLFDRILILGGKSCNPYPSHITKLIAIMNDVIKSPKYENKRNRSEILNKMAQILINSRIEDAELEYCITYLQSVLATRFSDDNNIIYFLKEKITTAKEKCITKESNYNANHREKGSYNINDLPSDMKSVIAEMVLDVSDVSSTKNFLETQVYRYQRLEKTGLSHLS